MKKFFEKHKTAITVIGTVLLIALVVGILVNGQAIFNVNP